VRSIVQQGEDANYSDDYVGYGGSQLIFWHASPLWNVYALGTFDASHGNTHLVKQCCGVAQQQQQLQYY
jgi:hypothetical protein